MAAGALALLALALQLRLAAATPETGATAISVDYPADGSTFPPDMTAPTFLWRDRTGSKTWGVV